MKKFLPRTFKGPQGPACRQAGFTLVELLVVITIIAVLAAVGATVYGSVQQTSRDSRRKADIEAISRGLETRYKDTTCGASDTNPYCPVQSTWFSGGSIPSDPDTTKSYQYPTTAVASYTLKATLEKGGGTHSDSGCSTTASGATAIYFCIKNQQ